MSKTRSVLEIAHSSVLGWPTLVSSLSLDSCMLWMGFRVEFVFIEEGEEMEILREKKLKHRTGIVFQIWNQSCYNWLAHCIYIMHYPVTLIDVLYSMYMGLQYYAAYRRVCYVICTSMSMCCQNIQLHVCCFFQFSIRYSSRFLIGKNTCSKQTLFIMYGRG